MDYVNTSDYFLSLKAEIEALSGRCIQMKRVPNDIFGISLPVEPARVKQGCDWMVIALLGDDGPDNIYMENMDWNDPGRVSFQLKRLIDEIITTKLARIEVCLEALWTDIYIGLSMAYRTSRRVDFDERIMKLEGTIFATLAA